MGTNGEVFAFENRGRVVFAMDLMPDGINPGFRDFVPGFEDLFSMRCALHLVLSPGSQIVYRTASKNLSFEIATGLL